jgi:hypothetical protein
MRVDMEGLTASGEAVRLAEPGFCDLGVGCVFRGKLQHGSILSEGSDPALSHSPVINRKKALPVERLSKK